MSGKSFPLQNAARVAVTLVLALGAAQCAPSGPRPPNLVIIALDTLRPDALGCYGAKRDTSPNLDAWAAKSVVFENAQTAAPWTAPSLLTVMTSLYPNVHQVVSFPDPGQMNDRVTTLAEVLREHGYTTAAFTDGGYAKAQFGLGQGFQHYPANTNDTPHEHASNLLEPRRLRSNVDRTLKWLDEAEDESDPFFLFFHTYEIHGPYQAPEEFIRRYRPDWDEAAEHAKLAQVKEGWRERKEIDAEGLRLLLGHVEHCHSMRDVDLDGLGKRMNELGVGNMEPEKMELWRDLYDAEIRHSDFELKRLLDRLDSPKLRDNTVVVFVSDHGESFGEHGKPGHGNALHEEALRVLLMVHIPGTSPSRVKDVVRTVDVMPTALEALGISTEGMPLQGRSLVPALNGKKLPGAPSFSHALAQGDDESRLWSVRDGRWRLVWDNDFGEVRLFDLETDPLELTDVGAAHADVAKRLLGLMKSQCEIDARYFASASGPVHPYQVTKEDKAHLAALGYVDHGADAQASSPPHGLVRPLFCDQ